MALIFQPKPDTKAETPTLGLFFRQNLPHQRAIRAIFPEKRHFRYGIALFRARSQTIGA